GTPARNARTRDCAANPRYYPSPTHASDTDDRSVLRLYGNSYSRQPSRPENRNRAPPIIVIAGLDPVIPFASAFRTTWMAGSSPAMTALALASRAGCRRATAAA